MDGTLPPIMQRSPIWPSSFPKVLAIGGILVSLWIVFGFEKAADTGKAPEINPSRLGEYNIGQAIALLVLMVAYTLLLRPLGFLVSTFLFLTLGSHILGEGRYLTMALVGATAEGVVWLLVDLVLGVFLRPFPAFMMGN